MTSDPIWEITTTETPCPFCDGTGSVREDVGGGEHRSTHCRKCGGLKTLLAVKLRDEYLRGYKDALNDAEKKLTELRRSPTF